MVYKTSWLASSLDYADKTQLATTAERRSKRSRTVLFRVLLNNQVRLEIYFYTHSYRYNRHNRMDCAYKEKRDAKIEQVRQQYICGLSWEKNNFTFLFISNFMYYLCNFPILLLFVTTNLLVVYCRSLPIVYGNCIDRNTTPKATPFVPTLEYTIISRFTTFLIMPVEPWGHREYRWRFPLLTVRIQCTNFVVFKRFGRQCSIIRYLYCTPRLGRLELIKEIFFYYRNGNSEIVEEVQVSGRNLASIDASSPNGEKEAAAFYSLSASGGSANYPELSLLASIQPIAGQQQQQQQQGSSVQTPVQGNIKIQIKWFLSSIIPYTSRLHTSQDFRINMHSSRASIMYRGEMRELIN